MKLITFDDGYQSVYKIAYPFLKDKDVIRICFIDVGQVGFWNRMTWRQLKELQDNNWWIGSHGIDHRDLTILGRGEMERQIVGSKKLLETNGFDVRAFAYPYGAWNKEVVKIVAQNYEWARAVNKTDGTKWTIPVSENVLLFHDIKCKEMIKI